MYEPWHPREMFACSVAESPINLLLPVCYHLDECFNWKCHAQVECPPLPGPSPRRPRSLGSVASISGTRSGVYYDHLRVQTLHDRTYKYIRPTSANLDRFCTVTPFTHLQCPNSNIVSYCSDAYIWSQTCLHIDTALNITSISDLRLPTLDTQRRRGYCWRCFICCTCKLLHLMYWLKTQELQATSYHSRHDR